MFLNNYFAPKKKKKNHTAAIVAGVAAVVAFFPLAVFCNERKKEWGYGSLLLSVTCRRSKKFEGKREITFSVPGVSFIGSCWRRAARICRIKSATDKAVKAETEEQCDAEFADSLSEDAGTAPEVIAD